MLKSIISFKIKIYGILFLFFTFTNWSNYIKTFPKTRKTESSFDIEQANEFLNCLLSILKGDQ